MLKWLGESKKLKIFLFLFPSIAVTLLLTGYGIAYAFYDSLRGSGMTTYVSLFEHTLFQSSLFFSVKVTFISTVVSLMMGLVIAKLLYSFLKSSPLQTIIWLPMLIPHFVAAYIVMLFLSQSGLISSVLYHLRFITNMEQFATIVFDPKGIGIMVTYIWKSVPFVVLMLLPVFYEMDERYSQVVKTLGGGKWEVFKMVEWPWIFPVVIEVGLILFAFIIAAFEVPSLLGVTNPKMISVLAYQWFYTGDWSYRSLSMALMMVITIFIIILAVIVFQWVSSLRLRLMKGRL